MSLLAFSIHLVCSTICVVISIFLFVIHIKQEKERSFVKVRRYLAYILLIDSITYFMSAVFISTGVGCFILKKFIVPAAFYFQMYLMTFALIELMFSQEVTKRKKQLMPLPVLILSVLYLVGYIAYSGNNFSIVSYTAFLETTVAHTLSRILVYVIATEMILCMFWLVKTSVSYKKGVGNYFSGSQAIGGKQITLYHTWIHCLRVLSGLGQLCVQQDSRCNPDFSCYIDNICPHHHYPEQENDLCRDVSGFRRRSQ